MGRAAVPAAVVLLLAAAAAHAQTSVDVENRYPSVGAIMVWRIRHDEAESLLESPDRKRGRRAFAPAVVDGPYDLRPQRRAQENWTDDPAYLASLC